MASAKKEYAAYDKLMMGGDRKKIIAGFEKVALPEFVYIDKAGKKTKRKEFIAQMNMQFQMIKAFKNCVSKVQSAKRVGGNIVVRVSNASMAAIDQGGATSYVAMNSVAEDVWVPKGGKLMLKSSKVISERIGTASAKE